ncbi:PaaX family transcriptional regulator C-terminal domain-containing protein [Mesobacterium sp. TK19101]|uniref:PaaX family transcriptional regulator C-terminal domain-containing protein n=1 Tax=Mesobacterium hydrothermale TaxID=3111907 RepID=A0ABU6HIV6_9RHOB|nr:PaaX family transcriptional regulator C-terminal domain-containing protein [Mesobacterium sp. TK19101]MEC3861774.1 PaaX family transcriptional regulator C-terminal domain-containing protein [Mesobacterium sp. TK19101]
MDPLAPLVTRLHAEGRLRVWSLVITVFGDSVQHRGGRIATARLSRLLGRIGIGNSALRTALSRLASDGWIEGRREGRNSSYCLTRKGSETFGPATARIYAPPRLGPVTDWVFDAGPDLPGLTVAGGTLRPADVPQPSGAGFRITGQLSPTSRQAVIDGLDPDHLTALERLAADLSDLGAIANPDPLTAASARILLIHRWRRLVLRWPELPAELMPDAITPRDLHAAVARRYATLSPRAEHWFDRGDGDMAAMPAAAEAFAKRFGGRGLS